MGNGPEQKRTVDPLLVKQMLEMLNTGAIHQIQHPVRLDTNPYQDQERHVDHITGRALTEVTIVDFSNPYSPHTK